MVSKLYLLCLIGVLATVEADDENIGDCFTKLKECLLDRICYKRVRAIDTFCCKKSFSGGIYSDELNSNCTEERFDLDMSDCINEIKGDCQLKVMLSLAENYEKYEMFDKKVKKLVPEPKRKSECAIFTERIQETELRLCAKNKNPAIEWVCELSSEVCKGTPIMESVCFDQYMSYLKAEMTEKIVREIHMECCREAINDINFYQAQEDCVTSKSMTYGVRCLDKLKEDCKVTVMKTVQEGTGAVRKFIDVVNKRMPEPRRAEECNRKRFDFKMETILTLCRKNLDPKLKWYCDMSTALGKKKDPTKVLFRK